MGFNKILKIMFILLSSNTLSHAGDNLDKSNDFGLLNNSFISNFTVNNNLYGWNNNISENIQNINNGMDKLFADDFQNNFNKKYTTCNCENDINKINYELVIIHGKQDNFINDLQKLNYDQHILDIRFQNFIAWCNSIINRLTQKINDNTQMIQTQQNEILNLKNALNEFNIKINNLQTLVDELKKDKNTLLGKKRKNTNKNKRPNVKATNKNKVKKKITFK